MKAVITTLFLLTTIVSAYAQIPPPVQEDTLIVQSVTYKGTTIRPSNWPCSIIYKSIDEFRFGEYVYKIESADCYPGIILYEVSDSNGKYPLRFECNSTLSFSGYIFDVKPIEHKPYIEVEKKPSFMGGDASAFSKWVGENLVYPESAKRNKQQGRVTLQFVIKADGSISDVVVLKGVCRELDAEAVRVVSKSPKWTPGSINGTPVDVTYTFPVIFQQR